MTDAAPRLARDLFGTLPDGRAVERVVLRGLGGFEAHVITYGATLLALIVPEANGRCEAPNRADFPSPRLAPDGFYRHHTVYRFSRSQQGSN